MIVHEITMAIVPRTRATELYLTSSRSGTVNCANCRARPAIRPTTTNPNHPPRGCHNATKPFRYAFSAPASKLPAPIQDDNNVKTKTGQLKLRPATRKSASFFTPRALYAVIPHSNKTTDETVMI